MATLTKTTILTWEIVILTLGLCKAVPLPAPTQPQAPVLPGATQLESYPPPVYLPGNVGLPGRREGGGTR